MKRTALGLAIPLLVGMLALPSNAAPTAAAPADTHVRRPAVSPVVARALGKAGEMRGMALNDGLPGRALVASVADFPRMAAEGITSVSVYVYLYVPNAAGTVISTGPLTPSDTELQAVAQAAHQNGMGVTLSPVLLDTAQNTWRGYYQPSNLGDFFTNYTAQLIKYATLAQQLGVSLFYVGSENDAISGQTAYWRSDIAQVRKRYSGAISYLATPYHANVVKFWDALDLASISVYFSMGGDANPSYDRFMAAWREAHTPYVRKLAKSLPKPLVYAEAGYSSAQHSFAHPEAVPARTAVPAPAAQADGYAALLDALHDNPAVYGVTWWRWQVGSTVADNGYSPNGKPAECVLAAHWSQDANVRSLAAAPVCDLHAIG